MPRVDRLSPLAGPTTDSGLRRLTYQGLRSSLFRLLFPGAGSAGLASSRWGRFGRGRLPLREVRKVVEHRSGGVRRVHVSFEPSLLVGQDGLGVTWHRFSPLRRLWWSRGALSSKIGAYLSRTAEAPVQDLRAEPPRPGCAFEPTLEGVDAVCDRMWAPPSKNNRVLVENAPCGRPGPFFLSLFPAAPPPQDH